jgi:penicillin-binding protein 1B
MAKRKKKRQKKPRRYSTRRFKVTVALLALASLFAFYVGATLIYHYFDFSRKIDERLRGERRERPAWVFSRPLEIHQGQRISLQEAVAHLNALRYQNTDSLEEPGTFHQAGGNVSLHLRRPSPTGGYSSGATVGVSFQDKWVASIQTIPGGSRLDRIELEPVPVTPLFGEDRAKSRWVPLDEVPEHLVHAIVATEDRRFFDHTGLDPLGILRAAFEDLRAQEVRQGGSTLTQQLVKNYFLTPERTIRRKLLEAFLAIILESRATKEEILELYMNDVYLGQRGSFGINGVGQGSRIFFDKDARNLTLEESALLAALIRSPNRASPFRHPERAKERRDIVLSQMARFGFIDEDDARSASQRPVRVVYTSVDTGEAPYFIDVLRRELVSRYSSDALQGQNLEVLSTLDYNLQKAAQLAVAEGLEEIQRKLPMGEESKGVQAALIALDPHNGDVLSLVGGRSYGSSQFNRAVDARRQPGSAFKPFVFLAAFERSYENPSDVFTPATLVKDEPTTFRHGNRTWAPKNYTRRFEGTVTYRQALSRSLNVATAKVGKSVGFERVVSLWDSMGTSSQIEPYPSLVLGTFEVSPMELASAYAVIANGGSRVEPRFFTSIRDAKDRTVDTPQRGRDRIVHRESAFLVTDLMRSVIDEGTGREIRARGFNAPAAGKTGTTDDTRDAWFVGFVPDFLAVVWVGYDDNRRLGLTGSQAALPIWTRFMKSAVAGREKLDFEPPSGITHARIDPASGLLATAACPNARNEVFLTGTEPTKTCTLH